MYGISSFTGLSESTTFDILQIITKEIENEEDFNNALSEIYKQFDQEIEKNEQNIQKIIQTLR